MRIIAAILLSITPFFHAKPVGLISRTKLERQKPVNNLPKRVLYGQASFYDNKFNGKRTANGEIFSQKKFTAACNILPLGTWLKVTNLKNGKSVKVRTTDRLHTRMRRLVDLSHIAAKKLGFLKEGLTRVKIEVLPVASQRRRR